MGNSPQGHKESDTTEVTEHSTAQEKFALNHFFEEKRIFI